MNHVGIWAFCNADNDLVLFSKTYDHEPGEDEVRRDGYLWYQEEDGEADGLDEKAYEAWHDRLCQPGLVTVIAAR